MRLKQQEQHHFVLGATKLSRNIKVYVPHNSLLSEIEKKIWKKSMEKKYQSDMEGIISQKQCTRLQSTFSLQRKSVAAREMTVSSTN